MISVLLGLWSGLIIGYVTEYYTSHSYYPVRVGALMHLRPPHTHDTPNDPLLSCFVCAGDQSHPDCVSSHGHHLRHGPRLHVHRHTRHLHRHLRLCSALLLRNGQPQSTHTTHTHRSIPPCTHASIGYPPCVCVVGSVWDCSSRFGYAVNSDDGADHRRVRAHQ